MKLYTIILLFSTLSVGLMAGLFYSWSISVTPGIGRMQDPQYLNAFQSMNRAILNPLFFLVFFGATILLPWLTYMSFKSSATDQFWCLLTATALYMGGIMAVTILGNIPLNNTLEALKIETMTPGQMASFRESFENKWNQLNWIRTISSGTALVLLIWVCIRYSAEN